MRPIVIVFALLALPNAALAAEKTATLAVKSMVCATCPITVRAAIAKVPGVKSVAVDFNKKVATVVFDDAVVTVEKLASASRDAGFPAERTE